MPWRKVGRRSAVPPLLVPLSRSEALSGRRKFSDSTPIPPETPADTRLRQPFTQRQTLKARWYCKAINRWRNSASGF